MSTASHRRLGWFDTHKYNIRITHTKQVSQINRKICDRISDGAL